MYNYYTIGIYQYKHLPMGVNNSLNIFKQKINHFFNGLDLSMRT